MKTTLLLLLATVGCGTIEGTETGSDDTNDTVDTSDTGDTGTLETTYATTWGADSVTLAIAAGAGTYTWGLAETDGSADPWTGEDCLNGYTLGSGDVLLYCHPTAATGATLAYGGNATSLDEATETVFSAAFDDTKVTHVVISDTDGSCVTWGAQTAYYSALSCTAI